MFIYNLNDGRFLVFCKQKANESILVSVTRDNNLLKIILEKFEQYFHKILLPEILTRKFNISNENERKMYCICRWTSFGNITAPDYSTCSYEWLRYGCVDITTSPKGIWFFSDC